MSRRVSATQGELEFPTSGVSAIQSEISQRQVSSGSIVSPGSDAPFEELTPDEVARMSSCFGSVGIESRKEGSFALEMQRYLVNALSEQQPEFLTKPFETTRELLKKLGGLWDKDSIRKCLANWIVSDLTRIILSGGDFGSEASTPSPCGEALRALKVMRAIHQKNIGEKSPGIVQFINECESELVTQTAEALKRLRNETEMPFAQIKRAVHDLKQQIALQDFGTHSYDLPHNLQNAVLTCELIDKAFNLIEHDRRAIRRLRAQSGLRPAHLERR